MHHFYVNNKELGRFSKNDTEMITQTSEMFFLMVFDGFNRNTFLSAKKTSIWLLYGVNIY